MIKGINSIKLGRNKIFDTLLFLLAFAIFWCYGVYYRRFWEGSAGSYVTTLLAFSYLDNGFCRRGLIGTLFSVIYKIFPAEKTALGATRFMWGMSVVYSASLILFFRWICSKIKDEKVYRGAYIFGVICFAFLIPTACFQGGAFGRADLLQMAVCLLQVYLLVERKCEWLTIPLTAVNVLFHEGYVLMTFGSVLIVLLYRAICTEGAHRKYWLLFGLNIAVCGIMSVLSLKGGNKAGTPESFAASSALAKLLNEYGSVHYNLLYMMAGYQPENAPVINDANFVNFQLRELPVFLVCFIPAFLVFGRGIVNLLRGTNGKKIGLYITAVLLGPALIAVEYIKYCDYGRYIVWIVFYFFVMFLAFAAMDDEKAKNALSVSFGYKNFTALLIVILMMIYQPIPICGFTQVSSQLAGFMGLY